MVEDWDYFFFYFYNFQSFGLNEWNLQESQPMNVNKFGWTIFFPCTILIIIIIFIFYRCKQLHHSNQRFQFTLLLVGKLKIPPIGYCCWHCNKISQIVKKFQSHNNFKLTPKCWQPSLSFFELDIQN